MLLSEGQDHLAVDAIIPPTLSDVDAQKKFPQGFETIRPYLRTVNINE